ncbi:MAG: HAMP domain-containing protein [Chromatiaceae bacterium]|nr:HAMP domain-containing protein [Chromatiaceae bacterium]
MTRPSLSLFQRTGLTLALGLGIFSMFALLVVRYYVTQPVTERAAEELAALLEFSAKVWVELPPWTRNDYELELKSRHGLLVQPSIDPLQPLSQQPEYLEMLAGALARRVEQPLTLMVDPDRPGWYWVDLPVGGQVLRLGFEQSRLRQHIPTALLLLGGAALAFVLLSTLLVVRHVTRPLSRLQQAVRRLGRGESFDALPETGTTELAQLAHRINRAEREVRDLIANRTTLLAGISHDLRTPIARMQLELALLEGQAAPDLLQQLASDLDEMESLIQRTLELARGLDRREASDGLLGEVAASLRQDYARAGESLSWALPRECPVLVPPKVFKRVLGNLIDNALRYGADQPVSVSVECRPGRAVVSVRDHGPGIPADQREAVLRPFHRLDSSRSRDTGGSGLGLAIVNQLCTAYGWTLVLADAPGGGLLSTVEFASD